MLRPVRCGQRVKGNVQPQWRELGERLAHTLRQSNGSITTPARLQGLVADLAAEHQELLLPLKDLVGRPAFQALIPKAGSGSGAVQRDVLIQDMEATFSRPVITALGDLLDGFLALPPGSEGRGAGDSAAPEQASAPGIPVMRLALIGLITAAAVAAGLVALRSTGLCALVGMCPGAQVSASAPQDLTAAEHAEQELRQASTLEAYEAALAELERQLLKLASAELTPEQGQQRDRLDQAARQARGVLAKEKRDAQRLKKATEALASAPERSEEQQGALLAVAAEELDAIPARSFSAPEANRLRRQLEQLKQDALEAGAAEPERPPESGPSEAPRPPSAPPPPPPAPAPARAPQPRPQRPAPRPAQPPPARSDNDAPYREIPLF